MLIKNNDELFVLLNHPVNFSDKFQTSMKYVSYIYIYLSMCVCVSLCACIYISVCVYLCVYIYIYIKENHGKV